MSPVTINLLKGLKGLAGPQRFLRRDIENGHIQEDRANEKLGVYPQNRPAGELICTFVNTLDALDRVLGLFQHVKVDRPGVKLLVTTAHAKTLPDDHEDVLFAYAPYPTVETATAFLDHWQPNAILWIAEDIDEKAIEVVMERAIPCLWINADIDADPSLRRRIRVNSFKALAEKFVSITPKTKNSRDGFLRLGVSEQKLFEPGELALQTTPLPYDIEERDRLATHLHARPIWLAQNVALEEVDMLMASHRRVSRRSHRLLLVLSPADKSQGAQIAETFEQAGWTVSRSSKNEDPLQEVNVHISDRPNERGLWMRLAPITFIGGTASGNPCMNPYEPASLGSVVLFGTNQVAFKPLFERLEDANAAVSFRNVDELSKKLATLLTPDKAAEMAMAAWDVTTNGAETIDHIRDTLLDALDGVFDEDLG